MIAAREVRAYIKAKLASLLREQGASWSAADQERLRQKCQQLASDAMSGHLSDADSRLLGNLMIEVLRDGAR